MSSSCWGGRRRRDCDRDVAIPINTFVESTLDPGDASGDNVVDLLDLGEVLTQFGTAGTADMNGDGIVDLLELGMVLNCFGEHGDRV